MRFGKQTKSRDIIGKGKYVELEYTITDEHGVLLDTTTDMKPMSYIHGSQHLFNALQKVLDGKATGDNIKIKLSPQEAYGEYDPDNIMNLEAPLFDSSAGIKKGMQFEISTTAGLRLVTVISVDGNEVTVDLNHPLAGKSLQIDATVHNVRDADPQELANAGLSV